MEDLNKLELPEIKTLCKQYGIGTVGDKKSLIKKLKYYLDPVEDVFDSYPRNSLDRRAFYLHLQKVLRTLKAIDDVDNGFGSLCHESLCINECIYDFDAQDILESN